MTRRWDCAYDSPNETDSNARLPYKMNHHRLMQSRVQHLTKVEGREGDLNVSRKPKDHCDGHLLKNRFETILLEAWPKAWCGEGSVVDKDVLTR